MALIGTLTSGVSALKTFTKDLEVIGNNVANVNTTAFKSSKIAISQDFTSTLRASQASGDGVSSVEPMQIGTGVKFNGVNVRFTQGALSTTGQDTDLGVSGSGYFLVKSTGDSSVYATRVGAFRWDDNGYLINSQGMRVQGLTGDYSAPVDNTSTAVGDIQLDQSLPTGVSRQSVSIDRSGQVVEFYTNGESKAIGKVLLQDFKQPSMLMNRGEGLYTGLSAAGPKGDGSTDVLFTDSTAAAVATTYAAGGEKGLGTIEAGTLELSNVDLTEEFANMITAQRSFQAASRVVTISDNVLEEIVNLKR